jgi:hypothetical protein
MSLAGVRSRLGVPQVVALALLTIFLAQCLWFIARVPLNAAEGIYVEAGLAQLEHVASAATSEPSPLVPLLAGIPARLSGGERQYAQLDRYRFWIRLPFLVATLLLGASLWYVARRLYGNIGGYVALALYCFSPAMVGATQVNPQIVGAWGAFGLVFTSIAVAHTLYAPREVVLWNWRRILLMSFSIAMCVGAQFSLWVVLLPSLAFMLWVAPIRRGAVLVIFASACVTALLLLWAVYGFHPLLLASALANADWLQLGGKNFAVADISPMLATLFLQGGLGLLLLLTATLVTFVVWRQTRFFGTGAPLIAAVLLVLLAFVMRPSSFTLLFVALPFTLLFMAGVSTDLLESRYGLAANALVGGVLVANAMVDVYGLVHIISRSR